MSYPITYADLTDAWPGNPLFTERCKDATAGEASDLAESAYYNDVQSVLADAPAISTKLKHDDECYLKHVSCFAARIEDCG